VVLLVSAAIARAAVCNLPADGERDHGQPGMGTWKSVIGLGKLQRRYLDGVSGQAAYFGQLL